MAQITSFEILDQEIINAGGKPTVLEALWDGDTQGWFLVLNLYTKTGSFLWKKEEVKQLGIVSFGGDLRLFNGEVPPWPEAVLAKEWGQQASEKYGLTFYFPSDKEPDIDCPNWKQRHLAIECADCKKLIIPMDSPYMPKDICYNCHLRREHNDGIKNAKPSNKTISINLVKGDERRKISWGSYDDDLVAGYLLPEKVLHQLTGNLITIVTLGKEDIIEMKQEMERALLQKPKQRDIDDLVFKIKTAEEAINNDYHFEYYFQTGFTERDDTILRFVRYPSEGSATIEQINKRYEDVLTPEEVMDTLKKLAEAGCLLINGDQVTVTTTGKMIV